MDNRLYFLSKLIQKFYFDNGESETALDYCTSKCIEVIYSKISTYLGAGSNYDFSVCFQNGQLNGLMSEDHICCSSHLISFDTIGKPSNFDSFFATTHYTWEVESFYWACVCLFTIASDWRDLLDVDTYKMRSFTDELMRIMCGENDMDLDGFYSDEYLQSLVDTAQCIALYMDRQTDGASWKKFEGMEKGSYISTASYVTRIIDTMYFDLCSPPEALFYEMLPEYIKFRMMPDLGNEYSFAFYLFVENLALYESWRLEHQEAKSELLCTMDICIDVLKNVVSNSCTISLSEFYGDGDYAALYYLEDGCFMPEFHIFLGFVTEIYDNLFKEFQQSYLFGNSRPV